MQIKQNSMAALANDQGWENMTEVEVQVASVKPNGERMQMTLPLSAIPTKARLRDASQYHYEEGGGAFEDEDDYFEHDELLVGRGGLVAGRRGDGGQMGNAYAGVGMRATGSACGTGREAAGQWACLGD